MERFLTNSVALVVPSNRVATLGVFFDAWREFRFWEKAFVVADGEACSFGPDKRDDVIILTNDHIQSNLGEKSWIISRCDSACRSYGFFTAWRGGYRYAVTLDDDTRPGADMHGPGFLGKHLRAIEGQPAWESGVPGLRTRGLPYEELGQVSDVVMNVGLWSGCPDLDAATSLVLGCPRDFTPPEGSRLIPRGVYVPVCGMNLCVTRPAVPLAYFGLQGPAWPYSRFDDIWMGVLAKRVMDHLGWSLAVGEPFVHHARESDPFVNLVKEAPGVARHESFWQELDALCFTEGTAAGCMGEAGSNLRKSGDPYTAKLGEALCLWASLFFSNGE